MVAIRFFLFLLLSNIFLIESHGQTNNNLNLIIESNELKNNVNLGNEEKGKKLENISEVKFVFLGLIKVYQYFLSSQQDKQVCVFKTSCSHFGQEAIAKYGLIYGSFMTADRLQRCNGFAMEYYKVDLKSGKCYDNLDDYYIWKRK